MLPDFCKGKIIVFREATAFAIALVLVWNKLSVMDSYSSIVSEFLSFANESVFTGPKTLSVVLSIT
jgi:hypothetical protein